MKTIRNDILALGSLFFLMIACQGVQTAGTEIGNPDTVALTVVGIEPGLGGTARLRTQGGLFQIDEARVVLADLEFVQAGTNCDETEESEIEFRGPYIVDLLTDVSDPDLGEVTVAAGRYCEIELRIEKLDVAEIPTGVDATDPIVEHSILVRGLSPAGTAFVVMAEFDEEFEIESREAGIVVSDTESTALILGFLLEEWFVGVDFASATVNQGQILIDPNTNSVLLETIKVNVKRSAKLYGDLNKDGILDDDEDDDILGDGGEID